MEVNAYMHVRNNLLTQTWLEHFIGRLMKTYENGKTPTNKFVINLWLRLFY
jgi:hypothetical protein